MEACVVNKFEKVCRICMKFDKTFISINSFQIIDMIIAFASVQIWENDDLPNQICNTCFLQLQNIFTFKQLCENSDTAFRQIIQRNNLSNNPNDFNNVKDEEFEDYADDNSLIDIKEDFTENIQHEKTLKNENELDKMQILTKLEKANDDTSKDIKNDENMEKSFTCEKCNKEFKKVWVLGQHMHRKHRAKVLKCNECELKFYHPLHLKEHQNLTHNPLNLICNTCNKVFVNIYDLKRHKFRHSTLQCQQCKKSFIDKCSFKKHKKEVHSHIEKYVTCHICGRSITKKNIHHHLATHKEREKITCDKCSKTFINDLTFKAHIKEIHGERIRKHLCTICGHASRSAADLRKHIRTHSNERPYTCDRCDKTFRCSANLKRHVSTVHLNERKFQCTFCPQAFCAKSTWVHHERLHTGEKPHKCEVCGKAFAQKIALNVHTKIHTNVRQNRTQNLDDKFVIIFKDKCV